MRPRPCPGAALWAWLQIAGSHGGVSWRKWHHALPWLLRYIVLEPSRIYESIKYDRRVERHRPAEDPIFVLGHWRSGTSFLQELLSLDNRYTTGSLFQCLFPECALTTRRWLPWVIDWLAAAFGVRYPIQDRPLRAALPAEEEIAMLCLSDPASSNWGQIFPSRMREHVPGLRADTPDEAWLEGYRFVVNKLSFASGGRRLVLKSPMNTARLPLLGAAYPEAVFVHIHRHPLDVFASSRRLWSMIMRQSALQHLPPAGIDQLILDVYEVIMGQFLHHREAVAPGRLIDVRYESLKADPVGILGDVYRALGLGEPPAEAVGRLIRAAPPPPLKPRSLAAALEQRIRTQWSFAFEAWGYE